MSSGDCWWAMVQRAPGRAPGSREYAAIAIASLHNKPCFDLTWATVPGQPAAPGDARDPLRAQGRRLGIPSGSPAGRGAPGEREYSHELTALFWSLLGAVAYSLLSQRWIAIYVIALQRMHHPRSMTERIESSSTEEAVQGHLS